MKTNKSFTKRLRITKNGKVLMRKAGQNHFRAKQNRRSQLNKHRILKLTMKNKAKSRFLATSSI